ncbi:MAG: DUF3800 domain-containing protein [Caenispirillum bisanense]|nr:DUF3800 domain-containing protein [Caenispirillum bisanense]MCA1974662.1 DUF3800 domain-containing protein [Caenispirillum sp.]
MYVVYLDEFGHDGVFIARNHPQHNASPVFGVAGFALPAERVREFASWFFQLKSRLLAWEIERSGKRAAVWEKKGAALFTTRNIERYPAVREAGARILNTVQRLGGFVVYYGLEKYTPQKGHDPKALYRVTLAQTIRELDQIFRPRSSPFMIVMDQHEQRLDLVMEAGKTMFGNERARLLVEPPFQVESHLYQTVQCADWICGMVGRIACHRSRPDEYTDFGWAETYFGENLDQAAQLKILRPYRRVRPVECPGEGLIAEELEEC